MSQPQPPTVGQPPSFRQVVAPPLTFIRALTAWPQLFWVVIKFYPSTVTVGMITPTVSPPKKRPQKICYINTKMVGRLENEAPFLGIHSLNFGGVRSLKLTVQPLKIGVKINLSMLIFQWFLLSVSGRVAQQGCLVGLLLERMVGSKIKSTTLQLSSPWEGEELYEFRRVKK